ncbi:KpsF/GutQ family sugar-phosphate isomerase [Photobacterium kishitanii]|uniref:Arabinose 5-phosphate isomerase n=1 Tax=Photobacterium kishitanii TaxID=318456 RepID=A0A0B7J4N0_9GAMM|nr:KpsF/GutQ family sugar-phosphate isomerase [Photobacterium kishitanii]PSU88663.1 KpsF/GutQ family sugar-phosphate isomerase [Photobacterium kishitanii]PSU93343.1 KpsF/GutQ family sugar-phosphate isomerase [Photobacterium kishitanii]PSU93550.1 KpsF/GutQ family sugar-phosphate isomerase [Photobacterium kishitanii]PSV24402.1 KpsF/GutQ family sugar-phosphate isomerase [Photobacterium kishitanii]PSW60449.1 KpsF/GutQ family sugar-phosphate isomerase [Photobacterium kishitanii]
MSGQFDFCSYGKKVLDTELQALEKIRHYIDNSFSQACELILHCQGKVIVMGMGKSGHIGRKIAATLASTGTPAFFVHPGEASHGDLGMIKKNDVVIAISNSGEATEILALLPVIKRLGIAMISVTGKPESSMAKMAQVHLQVTVDKEACPLNLAPTSSTTATLVMGDAVAIAVMEARGFTADDFALSHPGGALGRKLLLRIADVMHSGELLPMIEEHASIKDALLEISHKGLGMTAIVDHNQQLRGIFTDGDLRRLLDNHVDIHNTSIGTVMSSNPRTISPQLLAAEGLKLMEDNKINGLLVTENNQLVGALNMHDLLKAGVM